MDSQEGEGDRHSQLALLAAYRRGRLNDVSNAQASDCHSQKMRRNNTSVAKEPTAEGSEDDDEENEEEYVHGTMPMGQCVRFRFLTNWGDTAEIGVAGIDMFAANGVSLIRRGGWGSCDETSASGVAESTTPELLMAGSTSSPRKNTEETEIVPFEIVSDGRTSPIGPSFSSLRSLLTGSCNTHDERRMYAVAVDESASPHEVRFHFALPVIISAVRIFNYNGRGRSGVRKGVRRVEITVDEQLIFLGEIPPSTGELVAEDDIGLYNCENILYTEEADTLANIAVGSGNVGLEASAPRTNAQLEGYFSHRTSDDNRLLSPTLAFIRTSRTPPQRRCVTPATAPTHVRSLAFEFYSTWGHQTRVGLSALTLLDPEGQRLAVDAVTLHRPSGMTFHKEGELRRTLFRDDCRDRVTPLRGQSPCRPLSASSSSTRGMALRPITPSTQTWVFEHRMQLRIAFRDPVAVGAIEVANLAGPTTRGVRLIHLFVSSAGPEVFDECWAVPGDQIAAFEPPSSQGGGVEMASNTRDVAVASLVPQALLAEGGSSHSLLLSSHAPATPPPAVSPRTGAPVGRLQRLTPLGGVALRKAPTMLSGVSFQFFDLSLGIAPGNGIGAMEVSSRSLSASTMLRARIDLKRARMMARASVPGWLTDVQSYAAPLLPDAFVYKVVLRVGGGSEEDVLDAVRPLVAQPDRHIVLFDDEGEEVARWAQAAVALAPSESEGTAVTITAVMDLPLALSACALAGAEVARSKTLQIQVLADDVVIYDSGELEAKSAPSVIYFTYDERIAIKARRRLQEGVEAQ